MKIRFEGTLEEFRALFSAEVNVNFEPSGEDEPPITSNVTVLPTVPREVPRVAEPEAHEAEPRVSVPPLTDARRAAAMNRFGTFVREWVKGFEVEEAEQPDRVKLMERLSAAREVIWILQLAYEKGSLQRVIEDCLIADTSWREFNATAPAYAFNDPEWLDFLDRVSGHILQVSHIAFPDIVGTHDHSSRWRRYGTDDY